MHKNEKGYTIIEMLVALSLLGLLLFLSNDILGKIVLNNRMSLKAKAISIARNQMGLTLLRGDFRNYEKETDKFFIIRVSYTLKETFIKIKIQIFHKKRDKKLLYQLIALVPDE